MPQAIEVLFILSKNFHENDGLYWYIPDPQVQNHVPTELPDFKKREFRNSEAFLTI